MPNDDNYNSVSRIQNKSFAQGIDQLYPGVRLDNPLSKFSSYTYAITLYMLSSSKYNDFVNSGGVLTRKRNDPGIKIIAQSGGINSSRETRGLVDEFAIGKGAGFDYYIDDVNFITILPGTTKAPAANTNLSFKIYEPYGFVFLQDLARASEMLNRENPFLNNKKSQPNALQQSYVLGIRFYGYDVNGKLVSVDNSDIVSRYGINNFRTDQNAAIERFFPIQINSTKFKLDGKITTYSIEASIFAERNAFSEINGQLKEQKTVTAGTVEEALNGKEGLVAKLNAAAQNLKDKNNVEIPTTYAVEILSDEIKNAKLVSNTDFSKKTAPGATNVTSTLQNTIAESYKSTSYDVTNKTITFHPQSILHVIDNLIVKSEYITNALRQIDSETPETKAKANPESKNIKWFSVNPVVTVSGRDDKNQNWAYKITYQIKEYALPYIRSQYPARPSKYLGPYKAYAYWFTGENSEVISYEQTYDNLFYIVGSMSTNTNLVDGASSGTTTPSAPQNRVGGDALGGKLNKGGQIVENVRAQLYSPGDQVEAKMRILGDPDYLFTAIGVNQKDSTLINAYTKNYGPGLTINPLSGQVFIQVTFNTAIDYGNKGTETGTLNISNKLIFYETDAVQKSGITGLVYMVRQVDNTFNDGKFVQTLHLTLVPSQTLLGVPLPNSSGYTTPGSSSAGGREASTASSTDRANQSAAVAQRSGTTLNSNAGLGRGTVNPPLVTPQEEDSRQSSVQQGAEKSLNPPPQTTNTPSDSPPSDRDWPPPE